jgi:uncharacterized delta-60 repeat protein/uncharacterized repeat protein (TIGR01451 family)
MKVNLKPYLFLAVLIFTLLVFSNIALADPGDLDTTFDSDGLVISDLSGGLDLVGYNPIVVQSDGKIIVVGGPQFTAARYNTDGSLDTTFDSDGWVVTDLGATENAQGVALQSDGKIVVVGTNNNPGSYDFTAVRYNADGSLDTTFGTAGVATTDFLDNLHHDRSYAVAIQSDGKIVVGGYARMNAVAPVNNDFALVRYNTDGSRDATFGSGVITGTVTTNIGGSQDQIYALAIQSDGKILAAGYSNASGDYEVIVARYNTDGSLDTSFDTDGIARTSVRDNDDFGYGMVLQPDGKIVVAGYGTIITQGNHDDFILVRYNTDGSLDTSFDSDGMVVTDIALRNDHGHAVALQPDGKIIAVGYSQNAVDYDFAVIRYNTDGSLDTSFGTDGIVTTPIGSGFEQAFGVTMQTDGKILMAGYSNAGGTYDYVLARYLSGFVTSDLTIEMSDDPDPVIAGSSLTYVITVTNQGPITATGVIVTDTLPADVSGAVTSGCAEDPGGTPTCTLGTIDIGDSAVYSVTVTVDVAVSGTLTNTVQVGASSSLFNTEDDTVDETTTVQYELSVSLDGTGSGSVTSDPTGIDCGGDCTETFDYGTVVTLTATSTTGSAFTGWSGAECSGTGECVVTMTETKSVTATFTLEQYELSVSLDGTGSGSVTSDPTGIDCGSDCTETFDYGTVVTLTATPTTGSAFTGWSGAECSGTGECVVTMTETRHVTATFTLIPAGPSLNVEKRVVGAGRGTVDLPLSSVVTYTIVLANSGDTAATGVVMTDDLPDGVSFGGWVERGSAEPLVPTGTFTWTGTVPATASHTICFTATVTSDGGFGGRIITNTASFTSANAGSGSDDAVFTVAGKQAIIYLPLVLVVHS